MEAQPCGVGSCVDRDVSSTCGSCRTLPIQPPQYGELCLENSGLEWKYKLRNTQGWENGLLSPSLEETMLSASAWVFVTAVDTWIRLPFNSEWLFSTPTRCRLQRQWKLKLGDQVTRSDCQYLSLEQERLHTDDWDIQKDLPLSIISTIFTDCLSTPSGHIHYQRGAEGVPSDPILGQAAEPPVQHHHNADLVHIGNLAQELPSSHLWWAHTSFAMNFSPVYHEWEKKDYILNFQTDYVFPDSSYLSQ